MLLVEFLRLISSPARLMVSWAGCHGWAARCHHTIDKPIGHNGDIGIVPQPAIDLGVQRRNLHLGDLATNFR